MSEIGHNGGPPALGGDARSATKMHYFQAEIVKFRDGIRTLKADQRGVYLSILLEIYDAMGPIPLDPRRLSMATGLDARLINRVIPELVELGKLYVADGWVHNSRAEKEIHDYVRNHVRLSDVAKQRESAKRELRSKDQSQIDELRQQLTDALNDLRAASASAKAQTTGNVPETSPLALPQLSETSQRANGHEAKKHNKNNDAKAEVCQTSTTTRAHEESRTKNLEEEREDSPLPPRGGVTPAQALLAFEAFNAVAVKLALPQAAKLTPDRQRKIIARLREYGLDGWRRALDNIGRSKFLCGETDKGFRADLDFLVQAKSFGKLHDGGYGADRAGSSSASHDAWWTDPAKVAIVTVDQWRTTIRKHANGIWPVAKLGPPPGSKNCKVPAALITEMRLMEIYDDNGLKRPGAPAAAWMTH